MPTTSTPTAIPDVLIIEPKVFRDDRGFFFESFNLKDFCAAVGKNVSFVQDNHSASKKGVLRGLHYQVRQPQGKLIQVISGVIFDVAVDLRVSSNTYGQWVAVELSADNHRQLWVPEGFAHGFLVLSDKAELHYKVTDYWCSDAEKSIVWNDGDLAIDWPELDVNITLSDKDKHGMAWNIAPKFD